MTAGCVFYIASEGYLFSTLLSAVQARRSLRTERADVLIVCVGERSAESDAVERVCRQRNILFRQLPTEVLGGLHIVFARLMVETFVPQQYEQLLYVDGDTQIIGDLNRLFEHDVPPGRFAAALDPIAIAARVDCAEGARARARLASLGLREQDADGYVNAGVLRFNRSSWAELSARCISEYRKSRERFPFHDQDLLNVFGRDSLDRMSMAWNFPGFFLGHRLDRVVPPSLVHFMSNPRPWHGAFWPWGRAWSQSYLELIAEFPELSSFRPRLRARSHARYVLQQLYKRVTETPLWSGGRVRDALIASERTLQHSYGR